MKNSCTLLCFLNRCQQESFPQSWCCSTTKINGLLLKAIEKWFPFTPQDSNSDYPIQIVKSRYTERHTDRRIRAAAYIEQFSRYRCVVLLVNEVFTKIIFAPLLGADGWRPTDAKGKQDALWTRTTCSPGKNGRKPHSSVTKIVQFLASEQTTNVEESKDNFL